MGRPRMTTSPLLLALAALLVLGGCLKKRGEKAAKRASKKIPLAERASKKPPAGKKSSGAGGPVVAEKQPHPDFPTPRLARTEKIFLLEEPDRGPLVTRLAKLPALPGVKWATHSHCEVTAGDVACGPAGGGGVRAHWRIKRSPKLLLAQRRFGPRVERTYLVRRFSARAPDQMIALDQHGQVLWSRHYRNGGAEYGSRNLDGSNALTGCGSHLLERDNKGAVVMVGCRQWTGQPMRDVNGVVFTQHRRDRAGLSVELLRLNRDKKPQNGQDGVHRTTIERDAAGRQVLRRFFDKDGFPTLSSRSGCYGWSYSYDGRGLLERKTCLGTGDRPAHDSQSVCAYSYIHDGRGCRVAVVNLQLSAAKKCNQRFKRLAYDVNSACEIMTQVCHGATDQRTACGIREPAEYRYTRDALGRVTSRKHFGVDHKPGKDLQCEAFERRLVYDARGNVTRVTLHGAAGQAQNCSGAGYHGITNVIDDAGRTRESRFIDRSGNAGTNLGCAVRRYHYDNYDHQVKTVNYGFNGKIKDVRGMGSMRLIYDQGHRTFGVLLYDIHGSPARYRACFTARTCPRNKIWHAMRVMRRANGSVSKNLFFDHEGQLVAIINCSKVPCWK